MSSLKVERPRQLDLNTKRVSFDDRSSGRSSPALTPSPKKIKLDPEIRPRRRRTHSCSVIGDKKRRQDIVIPTKFHLGGNIKDPLNLEALGVRNKKELEPGNVTVKVIIPPNINDPLNLDACSEDGEEQLADAISRQRRRRKFRKRKRRNSEPTSLVEQTQEDKKMSASVDENLCQIGSESSLKPKLKAMSVDIKRTSIMRQISCPAIVDKNKNSLPSTTASQNKVVSNKRWRSKPDRTASPTKQRQHPPNKLPQEVYQPRKSQEISCPERYHPKNALYQYGNYSQYYGYRNPDNALDPRLKYFQLFWFEGKDVLDIGCNIGHITFLIARDFRARKVIGIDIDRKLIAVANKNFRHYISANQSDEADFPKSMRILYGPLKPLVNKEGSVFPNNVRFYQNNYVLEAAELLETITEEFDTILCLSVTKWIHLNFGDEGMKRFFSRIYRNLRPDGLLILEPQAWPSYKKKRKLTPKIFETYKSIQFYPSQFDEFLTKTLGFFHVHTFRVDHTLSKGFHRSLCVYRKPTDAERKFPRQTTTIDKSSQTEDVSPQNNAPEPTSIPTAGKEISPNNVAESIQNPSGESSSSKSSRVESPVIDVTAAKSDRSEAFSINPSTGAPVSLDDTSLGEPRNKPSPESTIGGDSGNSIDRDKTVPAENDGNSPIVVSTTEKLLRIPTHLEESNCDSTTYEVDQPQLRTPPSTHIPAAEK